MTVALAPALVVYCHPDAASFTARVRDEVVATLRSQGRTVDLLDLYADGFDPVFDLADKHAHDEHTVPPGVPTEHAERLRRAGVVVLVYPTWYGGPPAMLKGWIDRVFTPGVAYHLPPGASRVRAGLRNVRHIAIVTTHGSSKWVNAVGGEPGKRMIRRTLRVLCHPLARSHWIALYGMDRAGDAERAAFLTRVGREISRL